MKIITILLIVILTQLSSSQFPTNQDINNSDAFNIQVPNSSSSEYKFTEENIEEKTKKDLIPTEIESEKGIFGEDIVTQEIDLNKIEDLKGITNQIKEKIGTQGSTLGQQLQEVFDNSYNYNDTSSFTKESILKKTHDLKDDEKIPVEAQSIKYMDTFYANARSRFANLKTIECYVTRKLVNSYYCPLPSMNNSFFKGGGAKDSKEGAKEECEGLCQEQTDCLYKDLGKKIDHVVEQSNFIISNEKEIEVDVDKELMPKLIEINFKSSYKYKEDIEVESIDYNIEDALKALKNKDFRFMINVEYYEDNSKEWKTFIYEKIIQIKEIEGSAKIYLNIPKSSKYKILFFRPHNSHYDNKTKEYIFTEDNNLQVTLLNTRIEYVDTKLWFCSASHFVENAEDCHGELKSVAIGSTIYKVCVTQEGKEREPQYGAFWTEGSCQSNCKLKQECIPTYKHLSNYDLLNLPPELKDVELGCVNTPTNTSCTKELCEELFLEDRLPITEKTWTNDDSLKYTIENGVQNKQLVRPRIDIAAGLSANGNEEERNKVSLREMSEISYNSMISNNTYNISKTRIKEFSETKQAHYKNKNPDGSLGIDWLLKANSFDYDTNEKQFLYTILEIDTRYNPIEGIYNTSFGTQSGLSDLNIEIIDRIYAIKTPTGFKIFKRINHNKGKFKRTICSEEKDKELNTTKTICNDSYEWIDIPSYKEELNETFINGEYVAYDYNSQAPSFINDIFNSNKIINKYSIFSNAEEVGSIPGLLFKSQAAKTNGTSFTRVYTGGEEYKLGSSVIHSIQAFGLYSKKKLSYSEIFKKLKASEPFYSTTAKTATSIPKDSQYLSNKVNFYVMGSPNKMSTNIEFTPSSIEEGKRTFIYMLLFDEEK